MVYSFKLNSKGTPCGFLFFRIYFFLIGIPVLGLKVNIKFGLYIRKVENNGK